MYEFIIFNSKVCGLVNGARNTVMTGSVTPTLYGASKDVVETVMTNIVAGQLKTGKLKKTIISTRSF